MATNKNLVERAEKAVLESEDEQIADLLERAYKKFKDAQLFYSKLKTMTREELLEESMKTYLYIGC